MQLIAIIHDISSLDNGPPARGVSSDSNLGNACVGLNMKKNQGDVINKCFENLMFN